MIDGFLECVDSPQWKALKRAQSAVHELQVALEDDGFVSELAYRARVELTNAENQIREHFKTAHKRGI
jgi:hypothetical protein